MISETDGMLLDNEKWIYWLLLHVLSCAALCRHYAVCCTLLHSEPFPANPLSVSMPPPIEMMLSPAACCVVHTEMWASLSLSSNPLLLSSLIIDSGSETGHRLSCYRLHIHFEEATRLNYRDTEYLNMGKKNNWKACLLLCVELKNDNGLWYFKREFFRNACCTIICSTNTQWHKGLSWLFLYCPTVIMDEVTPQEEQQFSDPSLSTHWLSKYGVNKNDSYSCHGTLFVLSYWNSKMWSIVDQHLQQHGNIWILTQKEISEFLCCQLPTLIISLQVF